MDLPGLLNTNPSQRCRANAPLRGGLSLLRVPFGICDRSDYRKDEDRANEGKGRGALQAGVVVRFDALRDLPRLGVDRGPQLARPVAVTERATASAFEVIPPFNRLDPVDHCLPIHQRAVAFGAQELRRGRVGIRCEGRMPSRLERSSHSVRWANSTVPLVLKNGAFTLFCIGLDTLVIKFEIGRDTQSSTTTSASSRPAVDLNR